MGVTDFPLQGTVGTNLQPKRYDIVIYKGDTFRFVLELQNSGSPVDVTGWEALAQIRKTSDNSPGETPSIDVTVGGVNGQLTLFLNGTKTAALVNNTSYKYDLQVTDAAGNRRTLIGGLITVTEDVSE